jgi:branched-chain amino acid transport system substrate-binding protein
MKSTQAALAAVMIAGAHLLPVPAAVAQDQMAIVHNTYRTGPFSGSGIPIGNGVRDYFTMLNNRDGGIGGVRIAFEECETQYDTRRSVECWEQARAKNSIVYAPWSTGATLATIPRAHIDKMPIFLHGVRSVRRGRRHGVSLGLQPAADLLGRRLGVDPIHRQP